MNIKDQLKITKLKKKQLSDFYSREFSVAIVWNGTHEDFLKFRTVKYIPFNLINVNFKKIFLRYYKDTSLRKFHSLNGKKYFDFKGPSRIIKKLQTLNEI